jgi:Uma2 family endonuclease
MAQPQAQLLSPEFTDALSKHWTVADYLELQRESESRHEYVDGEIYAMAGGSKNHNRIAQTLGGLLNAQFTAGGCEAYVEEVLLEVRPTLFYYPDVFVACNANDDDDEYVSRDPVLVAEVLSKSTKRIDRKEKMGEYKKLPSLRECLLIHQDRVAIEHYYRHAPDAEWEHRLHTNLQDEISFVSIAAAVKVADVYQRVKFAPAANQEE